MRTLLALSLLAIAALAGCASTTPLGTAPDVDVPTVAAALPAPIHASAKVDASFAGANVAGGLPVGGPIPSGTCDPEPTAKCFRYAFTVNGTSANTTATLTWEKQGDDFDLYLVQGDTIISNDGINTLPPAGPMDAVATKQVMNAPVETGTYEFLVVAWNAAQDTFTLDATFS